MNPKFKIGDLIEISDNSGYLSEAKVIDIVEGKYYILSPTISYEICNYYPETDKRIAFYADTIETVDANAKLYIEE